MSDPVMTALRPVHGPILHAEGGYFTTRDGEFEYMDLAAQTLNLAYGHRLPAITEAIVSQANKVHFASSRFATGPFLELARRLAGLAPAGLGAVSLKLSNGSDAVETAIKLARLHTRRHKIAVMPGAWHGETYLTLGLATSHQGRILADRGIAAFADEASVAALTDLVVAGHDLAAVILDPVMVSQGLPAYDIANELRRLRQACNETGTLLIFDEIQAFGWTVGGLFTTDVHGIRPDFVCLGKALGAGLPLGAVLAREEFSAILGYNDAEFTGGGHPLSCAAALAGLTALQDGQPEMERRAQEFAAIIDDEFESGYFHIRRAGLMATIAPTGQRLREVWTRVVVAEAAAIGLFVRTADRGRRILIKPPLVLPTEELRKGLSRLASVCRGALSSTAAVVRAEDARTAAAELTSSVVLRKLAKPNPNAGYVDALLRAASPGLSARCRGPQAQQELTDQLAQIGVPVAATYAAPKGNAVDYGYVPGRTLQTVLSAPDVSDAWVNGLALRHMEVVIHAHDHGLVIGDRWPGNAIVNDRCELTLIDFELGYTGPVSAQALFEETFCFLHTMAAIDAGRPIRESLARRLLEQMIARHGSQRTAHMLSRFHAFYTNPNRPIHAESGAADAYEPLLLSALSRVTEGHNRK